MCRRPREVTRHESLLYYCIAAILDDARSRMARSINTAMVHACWLIGREIVLVEQGGAKRAAYGEQLLEKLGQRLSRRFGRGMGARTLFRARAFYLAFQGGSALAHESSGILTTALSKSETAPIVEWPAGATSSRPASS